VNSLLCPRFDLGRVESENKLKFIHTGYIAPLQEPYSEASQSSYGQRKISSEACRKKTHCSEAGGAT